MRLGFTGTRHGLTDVQAVLLRGLLGGITSFHHGGCRGADVEAARMVRRSCTVPKTIICYPGPVSDSNQEDSGVDDEVRKPMAHLARNKRIVDDTDELFACPFEMTPQVRGGTWFTIRYAIKKGKPVTIIWPDGGLSDGKEIAGASHLS